MQQLMIGQRVQIGWNAAKTAGHEECAYDMGRVEAFGVDWCVLRTDGGQVLCIECLEGYVCSCIAE